MCIFYDFLTKFSKLFVPNNALMVVKYSSSRDTDVSWDDVQTRGDFELRKGLEFNAMNGILDFLYIILSEKTL